MADNDHDDNVNDESESREAQERLVTTTAGVVCICLAVRCFAYRDRPNTTVPCPGEKACVGSGA